MDPNPQVPGLRIKYLHRPSHVKLIHIHYDSGIRVRSFEWTETLRSRTRKDGALATATGILIIFLNHLTIFIVFSDPKSSYTQGRTIIGNTFARYAQTITDNWRNRFRQYGNKYKNEKEWSDVYALLRLETEREPCLQRIRPMALAGKLCLTFELCEHIVTNTNETIYWLQTSK